MKNSVYLIVLLALGLIFVSYRWITSGNVDNSATQGNPALDNIMTRTSVRAYTDRQIDSLTLDTLLRAAMAAPTAGNKQPWRMVVIGSRATLDSIAANFHTMKMASQAQAAVVMCGDLKATFAGEGLDYWCQDVSAASENLLLAAHAVGLGAVWCGIYPISSRVERFSDMLNLPDSIVPMACICLGYPQSPAPTPKDKWQPGNVHYNVW